MLDLVMAPAATWRLLGGDQSVGEGFGSRHKKVFLYGRKKRRFYFRKLRVALLLRWFHIGKVPRSSTFKINQLEFNVCPAPETAGFCEYCPTGVEHCKHTENELEIKSCNWHDTKRVGCSAPTYSHLNIWPKCKKHVWHEFAEVYNNR